MRPIFNHVSFIRALVHNDVTRYLTVSTRRLLNVMQSSNSLEFGSNAPRLQCVSPAGWSSFVFHFTLIWAVIVGVFLLESVIFFGWTRHAWTSATVGLFLAFVAYAPLTQYATTLLSLCREYAFYDAHDYLLHQTGPAPCATRCGCWRGIRRKSARRTSRARTSWRRR